MTQEAKYPVCPICNKPIYPSQFRFKTWNQEMNFETKERKFVHLAHISDKGI